MNRLVELGFVSLVLGMHANTDLEFGMSEDQKDWVWLEIVGPSVMTQAQTSHLRRQKRAALLGIIAEFHFMPLNAWG